MNKISILFVGLDTHKEFTEVVYCLDERGGELHHLGRIKSTKPAISKLARTLQSKFPHATLHFVYEAGQCGYWVYRYFLAPFNDKVISAPKQKTALSVRLMRFLNLRETRFTSPV